MIFNLLCPVVPAIGVKAPEGDMAEVGEDEVSTFHKKDVTIQPQRHKGAKRK